MWRESIRVAPRLARTGVESRDAGFGAALESGDGAL
jgi:hypothetical protein